MKFIVSSSTLLKQLSLINGVISNNPVVPILENFLFEINGNTLRITSSDLQTSIITEIEIESKQNGSIAVPAKILLETLRNLPEQPITFTIEKNSYTLELSSDNGRYKLAGENATDFPKIPSIKNAYSITIDSDVLNNAIASTIFATSNDELKPQMTGVCFNFTEKNAVFVATDGHRLVRYRRSDIHADSPHMIIVPRKALNLLKTSLPNEKTSVKIDFNASNAFFSFNNIHMICRLIDERFPDYENVIPNNNPNKLTIDRLEFLSSLKRIAIYANKTTNQVRLKISGSEIQIHAEDLDFSNEANERLSCEYDGESIEIGFNAKFLIELLNNLEAKTISLELSTPNKAGIILPKEKTKGEDILMLVMPVMLNTYA